MHSSPERQLPHESVPPQPLGMGPHEANICAHVTGTHAAAWTSINVSYDTPPLLTMYSSVNSSFAGVAPAVSVRRRVAEAGLLGSAGPSVAVTPLGIPKILSVTLAGYEA